MQTYTLTILRSLSKPNGYFENYHIDRGTRFWIIPSSIRKQHKPYRRSRAVQTLFHRIHTLNLHQWQNQVTGCITCTSLTTLHNMVSPLEKSICLSHINAHSIQGKIEEFQKHVIQKKTDVCIITESWLKNSDITGN